MSDDSWFKAEWIRRTQDRLTVTNHGDEPLYVSWDMGSPDGDVGVEWKQLPNGTRVITRMVFGGRQQGKSERLRAERDYLRLVR